MLFPYLFIVMEEVFSWVLNNKFEEGTIGRFFHLHGEPLVSHLLYTDDLLIFSNGENSLMKMLMKTLELYEKRSGQVISKEKSIFYPSKNIIVAKKGACVGT